MNTPPIPPSNATHTNNPHNNDVLCGRGGTINAHPGNEQYRKFVDRKKRVYLTARFKREKRLIAQSIVEEIRNLDPPGRFLTKDPHGETWRDVGDEKARDKTSQALRENALSVRKQMEEEFQETRRQQAREVAISAGRDPDEAVENMMSAAISAKAAETKMEMEMANSKKGANNNKAPHAAGAGGAAVPAIGHLPPGSRGQPGFVGRVGFGGPLYDAQQPAPPTAQWGYHPPPTLQQTHSRHGAPPHPHGAPPPHYPFFPPPNTQSGGGMQQHHHPQQQQQPAPPPSSQPGIQPAPHQPASSQQQHQQQYQQPYTYGGSTLPPQPGQQPPSQPPQSNSQQPPPPHPHQYPQYNPSTWQSNPQHSQSHQSSNNPQHTISQPMMPPAPGPGGQPLPHHPMIPNTFGGHPSTINHPSRATVVTSPITTAQSPSAAIGVSAPIMAGGQIRHSSLNSSCDNSPSGRHVQFQNDIHPPPPGNTGNHLPSSDPRRGIAMDDSIPFMISSKKRIQPRKQPPPPGTSSIHSDYTPDHMSSSGQSTVIGSPSQLSPRSQSHMSQAMSHATQGTEATPLTFLSTDMSVKTSDSLNHYLQGLEDEISGDVGQEVELVAHAPMLDGGLDSSGHSSSGGGGGGGGGHHGHSSSGHHLSGQHLPDPRHHHHHHHGRIPNYSRSTPPRHHRSSGKSGHSGSSQKSGSSRRKKKRSGNHIPSNSGKVQLDLSRLGNSGPHHNAGGGGGSPAVAGPGAPMLHGGGPLPPRRSPVQSNSTNALPCGTHAVAAAAAAGCGVGVILPTPLRSSNSGPNRSPTTTSMAPPPGVPPSMTLSPVQTTLHHQQQHHNVLHPHHSHHHHYNALHPHQQHHHHPHYNNPASHTPGSSSNMAPMSPVHSLDLEKMSLCGTENVSQTGGSIGGASLCNVFDDQEDSVVGASALMDMTMSLGSHPSSGGSGPSTNAQSGMGQGMGIQGIQPVPLLGLNPQTVFGDQFKLHAENESLIAGSVALMDMSVGSNDNTKSKTSTGGSQNSGSGGSSSRSTRRSGSPASVDKKGFMENKQMESESFQQMHNNQQYVSEGREQPPGGVDQQPQPVVQSYYGQDFKFTWDGKRVE